MHETLVRPVPRRVASARPRLHVGWYRARRVSGNLVLRRTGKPRPPPSPAPAAGHPRWPTGRPSNRAFAISPVRRSVLCDDQMAISQQLPRRPLADRAAARRGTQRAVTAVGGVILWRGVAGGWLRAGERGRVGRVVALRGQATFPWVCLLYTSPSPRDGLLSRMPSSA